MKILPLVDFKAVAAEGCFVYCYLRERDSVTGEAGTPYYVGIASQYKRPFQPHSCPIPSRQSGRVRVLRSSLTWEQACKWEEFYIQHYGRKNNGTGILANLTDGADGCVGRETSDEQRVNYSEGAKRRFKDPEQRQLIAGRLQGVPKTKAHKEALSKAATGKRGRTHSAESKAKISASNRGKKRSAEHCQAHGLRITALAAERYGLPLESYLSLSRQHRINMSTWLKRKPGRTPAAYVELYGKSA